MSKYRYMSSHRIFGTYEGVAALRTEHGLVRVMRKANEQEPEYQTFDPYVTVAVIRLGEGELLERS